MLKILWKQMRWSLRTQVIVVLFAGYLLVLWEWREPWVHAGSLSQSIAEDQSGDDISPDLTRKILSRSSQMRVVSNRDQDADDTLQIFSWRFYGSSRVTRFMDDDTIITHSLDLSNPRAVVWRNYILRRRFPEWWWGHFYRPEVWLLPLWLGLIVWTLRRDRAVPK